MFGQNKPLFGANTSAFGAPSTSGFGAQPTASAFGQPQQTPLFGQPAQPAAFGAPASTGGLFGQPAQPSSIFGGTSTAQPATSGFGSTLASAPFGAKPAGTGIFGGSQTGSVFGGGTSVFGGQQTSAFGAVGVQPGTPIRFNPTTGTDTVMKNGAQQSISTRHMCITVMKEYEPKSFEELRMEDYLAGRKTGGQQGATTSPFGAVQPQQSTTGLFGTAASTAPAFGQQTASLFGAQNKPAFGTTTTTSSAGGLFGSSTFGQTKPAFGATGFGQPQQTTTSLFGQPQAQPTTAFGAPVSTGGLFGSQPAQLTQAKPFSFGQATTQPSLFGTAAAPAFGATTATLQTTKPSLFGTTPAPAFGTATGTSTPFPTFSATTTTTPSLFGTNTQASSLFNPVSKPFSFSTPAPTFGQTQPTAGLLGGQTSTMFAGANTGFGAGGGLFGNTNTSTTTSGLFGSSLTQPTQPTFGLSNPLTFGSPQQPTLSLTSPQKTNHDLLVTRLQTLPYGTSTLINDLSDTPSTGTKIAPDAKAINQFKVGAKPAAVKRIPASKPSSLLFDGIDDEEQKEKSTAVDIFKPRKNIKKLVLKPKGAAATSSSENAEEVSQAGDDTMLTLPDVRTHVLRERPSPDNTVLEFRRPTQQSSQSSLAEFDATPATSKKSLELSLSPASIGNSMEDSSIALSRIEATQRRCGIKSTRPDYYTRPELDTLDELYNEDTGECVVNNFTIGRKGYGSIYWEGPLDVAGLDLDQLVHIRRKEVIVYPDDDDKPAQGEKLNRPAQITLDQVWPVDKSTREIIKDRARLEKMRYAEKLEITTAKLKAVFIDYRPESGSWVFRVRHFSKYGLLDDDEEEEDMVVQQNIEDSVIHMSQPLQQLAKAVKQIEPSSRKSDLEARDHTFPKTALRTFSAPQETFYDLEVDVNEKGQPIAIHFPAAQQQSAHFQHQQQMDHDYDDGFSAATLTKAYNPFERMRNVLFDEDEEKAAIVPPMKKKQRTMLSFSHRSATDLLLPPTPEMPLESKKVGFIELPKAVRKKIHLQFRINSFPSQNKVIRDISSIKCAPCPRVSFAHGSSRLISYRGSTVYVHSLEMNALANNVTQLKRIETHLTDHTAVRTHPTLLPIAEIHTKINNPHNLPLLEKLVVALYGDLQESADYARAEERKNRVIDWLCLRNRRYPEPAKGIDRIMYLLAVNDMKGAADECIRQRQPRLATLIACATCESAKELILQQLDSWKVTGADELIETDILRLYILLSGANHWVTSSGKDISPHQEMEWSQQLALLLMYTIQSSVADCIEYLFTDTNDVEYHMLAAHTPAVILSACSSELEAWFLQESLISYRAMEPGSLSDAVSTMLVAQICHQSPKWASFVALHIRDDSLREHTVEEIINRGYPQLQTDDLEWLEKSLSLPQRVTANAEALIDKAQWRYEDLERELLKRFDLGCETELL